MAGEGGSGGGGTGSGSGGGGGGGPDADSIAAIIAYLNHIDFGTNGDYTGNAGSGGDNVGPPGSQPPPTEAAAPAPFGTQMASSGGRPPGAGPRAEGRRPFDPYRSAGPLPGPLSAFVGRDVDPYTGMPSGHEAPDPYSGLPEAPDPFEETGAAWRSRQDAAALIALRRGGLLSSPYLLAQNDAARPLPDRRGRAESVSDFDPHATREQIEAQAEESNRALAAFAANPTRFVVPGTVDFGQLIEAAARQANSPEHKLGYTVNQLRTTPVVVERSPEWAGIKQMGWGTASLAGSAFLIGVSDGLALPLVGAMGISTGVVKIGSGFTLAISGASSTETIRYEEGFDYVFSLTASPTGLAMGSLGLPFINGDQEISHNLALAGGLAENLFLFPGDPSKLYSRVLPGTSTAVDTGGTVLRIQEASAIGNRALGSVPLAARADEAAAVAVRMKQVEEWSAVRGTPLRVYGDPSAPGSITVRIGDVEKLGFRGYAGDVERMTLSRNLATGERAAAGDLNAAADKFRQVYQETGRADLAGTAAHEVAGAAGPGQGVDFASPLGGHIADLRTHGPWTMMDQSLMNVSSTKTLNYSIQRQIETFIKGGEALTPIRSNIHLYINEHEAVKVVTP